MKQEIDKKLQLRIFAEIGIVVPIPGDKEIYVNTWEIALSKFEEKCNYKPSIDNNKDLLAVSSIQESILIGVNWQQERSYSQEDLANALHSVELKDNKNYSKIHEGMKEWFEQFKKK